MCFVPEHVEHQLDICGIMPIKLKLNLSFTHNIRQGFFVKL